MVKRSFCLLLSFVAAGWAQSPVVRDLSCVAVSGSGTAYACNIGTAPTGYVLNGRYAFQGDVANAGVATINFNSLGAKTIKKFGGTDLVANDIKAGQWVNLIYDGTNMQMVSPQGQYPTAAQTGAAPATAGTAVLKGNGNGGTSTAVATDVVNLFSSCSGTQYLGADGACHTSGGSGSGIAIYGNCIGGGGAGTYGVLNMGDQPVSGSCSAAWTAQTVLTVTHACTLKNLYYGSLFGAGFDSNDQKVTVWTASSPSGTLAASALTCTAGATQACHDTTHSVSLGAGAIVSVKIVTDAAGSGSYTVAMDCQ